MGPGFESLREHNFYGPVAQLAEATDSKPVQCEFESHPDYFIRNGYSSVEVVGLGLSNLYKKKQLSRTFTLIVQVALPKG